MVNFSHFEDKASYVDAVDYTFYDLAGEPTLTVRQAGEDNTLYFNALLRQVNRSRRRGRKVETTDLKANRKLDIGLYSKFVVVGWINVKDSSDKVVEFSIEAVEEFLNAIPSYMFDDMREFCTNPENFVEGIDEEDTEEAAKN